MARKVMERGLGKGLDALLGDSSLNNQGMGSNMLPISQVQPGLNQPRKRFEEDAINELADSVREHGILNPILVRRLGSGYYQIIAGERRWRAARQIGLSEVPVRIIEADDRKVMEIGLIENLQREDLNPVEEALGYRSLIEEFNLSHEDVAERMGKSRSAITNALRLLALPQEIINFLETGDLSAGHARALLGLESESQQTTLASKIVTNELSVRQTEAEVAKLKRANASSKKPGKSSDDFAIYYREAEKNLETALGRKVHIQPGKRKGKLELEYYSPDDLEILLEALKKCKLKK